MESYCKSATPIQTQVWNFQKWSVRECECRWSLMNTQKVESDVELHFFHEIPRRCYIRVFDVNLGLRSETLGFRVLGWRNEALNLEVSEEEICPAGKGRRGWERYCWSSQYRAEDDWYSWQFCLLNHTVASKMNANGYEWAEFLHPFQSTDLLLCPSVRPSIHLCLDWFMHPCICPFLPCLIHQPIHPIIHPSIDSFMHPCIGSFLPCFYHPSIQSFLLTIIHIYRSMHACICSFIHSFVHPIMHTFLFIHKFVLTLNPSFINFHPSIHPSIIPLIRSIIHSFIHPFIHPSILSFDWLACPFIWSSTHPSIHPSDCPLIYSFFDSCVCTFDHWSSIHSLIHSLTQLFMLCNTAQQLGSLLE